MNYLTCTPVAICYQGLQSWFIVDHAIIGERLHATAIPRTDLDGKRIVAGWTRIEKMDVIVWSYKRIIEVVGSYSLDYVRLTDSICYLPDPKLKLSESAIKEKNENY